MLRMFANNSIIHPQVLFIVSENKQIPKNPQVHSSISTVSPLYMWLNGTRPIPVNEQLLARSGY